MRYLKLISIGICFLLLLQSCTNKDGTNNHALNHQDSLTVLGNSLSYILNHIELPKEFSSEPLQIAPSKVIDINSDLKLDGYKFLLLSEDVSLNQIISHLDVFKPVPLIEVLKFNVLNNQVHIHIFFRATGHLFDVTVDKNHKVVQVDESTI